MGKGKSASKNARTIEQYCSVCKKTFEMPVVEGADNNEVTWLKCPGCKGFLPCMINNEQSSGKGEGEDSGSSKEARDLALEDIDTDKAIEYGESSEYKVGDIIYHRSWNDYGKVLSKEMLPGFRKTILVQFINQGTIRLLEGVT